MTRDRAQELAPKIEPVIESWQHRYSQISLCLGQDYLPALPEQFVANHANWFKGPIGRKREQLGAYLRGRERPALTARKALQTGRLSYFLPDWDDLLDPDFDFREDSFSAPKAERKERHCSQLMRPDRIADGILVSLAQARTAKGPLKYVGGVDARTLRPIDLRGHYGLDESQMLFGDCGAFSYVNDEAPPLTTQQAVSLYDLYSFDMGASIDHIPVMERVVDGRSIRLSEVDRRARVALTVTNAEAFLREWRRVGARFEPVGTVQGLEPSDYARNASLYADMGYRRIALGGLVPLPDQAVLEIAQSAVRALRDRSDPPSIHLFGVFRPKLQQQFRELGISSFDSATYFRKAWLRSGQNYLAKSGEWYSAIRVPMTSDGRTRAQLLKSGCDLKELEGLEAAALAAAHAYNDRQLSLEATLDALEAYDRCLTRSSEDATSMRKAYAKTLADRPWENCGCQVCKTIGIDVIIFRGSNRNKRRGAHNTLVLYQTVIAKNGGGVRR
jgi:hypothetical protein